MKLNKLAALTTATLLTIASANAMAEKNATVTFTGAIANATCDVSASQKNVDLGTHAAQSVTDISNALSAENFNLNLTNCSDDATDPEGVALHLSATGNTLEGNPNLFADTKASQIGVKLSAIDGSNNPVPLKANDKTALDKVKFAKDGSYTVPVKAELFATVTGTNLNPQMLNVPVTFGVAYN
ncbi:fimbrial protein [Morganella morganii]|uniref:fimbrial protein n=1 Tax=Morganella morganii TaxID=582 RepID=UPI0034E43B2D